mmetsp:Transcript_38157/g.119058  ORF Transcript_38157/g.119058 Transcript_38157/m.119058 type:complete len:253 (+) Transcript_38157:76-834(+)
MFLPLLVLLAQPCILARAFQVVTAPGAVVAESGLLEDIQDPGGPAHPRLFHEEDVVELSGEGLREGPPAAARPGPARPEELDVAPLMQMQVGELPQQPLGAGVPRSQGGLGLGLLSASDSASSGGHSVYAAIHGAVDTAESAMEQAVHLLQRIRNSSSDTDTGAAADSSAPGGGASSWTHLALREFYLSHWTPATRLEPAFSCGDRVPVMCRHLAQYTSTALSFPFTATAACVILLTVVLASLRRCCCSGKE